MNKMIRGKAAKLSRRTFVVGSAAAGGGLAHGRRQCNAGRTNSETGGGTRR